MMNNMDIFKFINSRDIRDYLKSIEYKFSSIEAAWIIWQSRYATLEEKHAAWEELIATTPDCEIKERPNTRSQKSLHTFLAELIAFENRRFEYAKEEADLIHFGLNGLWFEFPTPFKKGDIIYDPERPEHFAESGPCVIEHEIPWRRDVEKLKRTGDASDMLVDGIFQMENGTVYHECTASYMNFEYYREPLIGKRRIMGAISNYLKEEISLELLLNAYHTILAEEQIKDTRPWNITKERLELAFIPEGE